MEGRGPSLHEREGGGEEWCEWVLCSNYPAMAVTAAYFHLRSGVIAKRAAWMTAFFG